MKAVLAEKSFSSAKTAFFYAGLSVCRMHGLSGYCGIIRFVKSFNDEC